MLNGLCSFKYLYLKLSSLFISERRWEKCWNWVSNGALSFYVLQKIDQRGTSFSSSAKELNTQSELGIFYSLRIWWYSQKFYSTHIPLVLWFVLLVCFFLYILLKEKGMCIGCSNCTPSLTPFMGPRNWSSRPCLLKKLILLSWISWHTCFRYYC